MSYSAKSLLQKAKSIENEKKERLAAELKIKNENRMFFYKKKSYKIKIHKFKLPKSQVTILDDDTGFEGFKFIKITYWLVKKNPEQFKIISIFASNKS
jgi:hypothetical protein